MAAVSGEGAGVVVNVLPLLSQRSRVQSPAWAEFMFCFNARSLDSLSLSSLRGRLNEYQSRAGKVTVGCGRVSDQDTQDH